MKNPISPPISREITRNRTEAAIIGTIFAGIGFLAALVEYGNQMVGLWCPIFTAVCLTFCFYRLRRALAEMRKP